MGFLEEIKRVSHTPEEQWCARGPGGVMPGRKYFLKYMTTGRRGDGVGFLR